MKKGEEIFIPGVESTISLMEWLRNNDCPECNYNVVYFVQEGREPQFGCIVSSFDDDIDHECIVDCLNSNEVFEYEGMRRWHDGFGGFDFAIDGKYYYATF